MSTLSVSFRTIQSKLKELCWWQAFSYFKSMWHYSSHSNQSFHWFSMKSFINAPPEACYRWEIINISPQTVMVLLLKVADGQRIAYQPISFPWAFGPGAKNCICRTVWTNAECLRISLFFPLKLVVWFEVLRPSQPNGVMSSTVSLPNHRFTGQA